MSNRLPLVKHEFPQAAQDEIVRIACYLWENANYSFEGCVQEAVRSVGRKSYPKSKWRKKP